MLLVLQKEWLRLVPLLVATVGVGIGAVVGYSPSRTCSRPAEFVAESFGKYLLEESLTSMPCFRASDCEATAAVIGSSQVDWYCL
jgi:hypothetical protein